jgi:hypothetical protein
MADYGKVTRWQPGQSGNPLGRPRDAFSAQFFADVVEVWEERGKAAMLQKSALDMLVVAHTEFTSANIETATDLFKEACRRAGKLDPHSP